MSSNTKMCFFCKNSGENEKTYTSHTKHTCQKLANIECLKCGAKGHTERYCDDSGRKYTTPQAKKPAADCEWKEVTGGAKKTPLVFHVGTAVAQERPATPPPPPKNDEDTFPTLVETTKPTAAKTLNFAALKFEQQPTVVKFEQQPTVIKPEPVETIVTSNVVDEDFPALPQRRSSPPARPPPMPTIQESEVANITSSETVSSNISAAEMPVSTTHQLTSVVTTLSTSLQLMNTRYEAKCAEYDALLQAYNALVQQQQWGQRGSSWADEPMN